LYFYVVFYFLNSVTIKPGNYHIEFFPKTEKKKPTSARKKSLTTHEDYQTMNNENQENNLMDLMSSAIINTSGISIVLVNYGIYAGVKSKSFFQF
jgi:hypothetical protein